MALTRRQLQDLRHEELRELRLPRQEGRPTRRLSLAQPDVVRGAWPVGIGLAWYGALALVSATTPAAPEPASAAALDGVIHLVLFAAIGAMAVGLARRSRAGLLASAGAGLLMLALVVACPVTGHHEQMGAWWFAQLGAFTAVTGASLVALRRAGRTQ